MLRRYVSLGHPLSTAYLPEAKRFLNVLWQEPVHKP